MNGSTPIFLIVGAPAVGKSSTAHALAARFPKSIHIPVDDVRDMVVSGLIHPSDEWGQGLIEQLTTARASVSQMAITYNRASFVVVIDDFWDPNSQLSEYKRLFAERHVHRVLLYPSQNAALARNLGRSGTGEASEYIAGGIQLVYAHLEMVVDDLEQRGWFVLDTTDRSVEETVAAILDHFGIYSPLGEISEV